MKKQSFLLGNRSEWRFRICNNEYCRKAEKAVEMFHCFDLNGRLLTVNKAAPRGTQPERSRPSEPSFRIHVGNLAWQVDDARLEQVFGQHGKVVNARVVSDRETGRSHGFGFVMMSSETELNDALAALDGHQSCFTLFNLPTT